MRYYELMWILGGDSPESEGEASVSRVSAMVAERGGELIHTELWGRRTLSYPIGNHRDGAYYLAQFSLDGSAANDVEKAMLADQSVLRHLLVRTDKPEPRPVGDPDGDPLDDGRDRRERRPVPPQRPATSQESDNKGSGDDGEGGDDGDDSPE